MLEVLGLIPGKGSRFENQATVSFWSTSGNTFEIKKKKKQTNYCPPPLVVQPLTNRRSCLTFLNIPGHLLMSLVSSAWSTILLSDIFRKHFKTFPIWCAILFRTNIVGSENCTWISNPLHRFCSF